MSTPAENPFAGQGSVLLDIGGEIGALVVAMPVEMEGAEVEIRPAAAQGDHRHGHVHHPHVAVVIRPVAGGRVPSLVFPEVREGRYGLGLKDTDEIGLEVEVVGGQVTTTAWPA